jgi:hypothetical protein
MSSVASRARRLLWILLASLALAAPGWSQQYDSAGNLKTVSKQGAGAGAATNFWNFRLTNGTSFYDGLASSQLPAALVGGRLDVNLGALGNTALSGANVVDAGNTAFRVNCVVGCGGSSFSDNSAFTFGTTAIGIVGYVLDDVSPNAVTENRAAAPRMSANRVAYAQIRDAAGNERGVNVTVANALVVEDNPGVVAAVTAAWTSATAVDTVLSLTVTGYSTVAVSFRPVGTITAGGINFEASDDGGSNWYAVSVARQGTAVLEATYTFSTLKLWQAGVEGLTTFRVRLNPVISGAGTANIRIQASAAPPETWTTVSQVNAADLNATVKVTDGSTTVTFTGTSINVNCTGGCGTPTQAQTYFATAVSAASAASKDYLNLFNASGSGKILRILNIGVISDNTAAIAGVGATLRINQITTAGSTCTALTIQKADSTNAAVPAQVTFTTNCTTDPTIGFTIGSCHTAVDEAQVLNQGIGEDGNCYRFANNGGQPITLREGQGINLVHNAVAPVGLITIFVEFTM